MNGTVVIAAIIGLTTIAPYYSILRAQQATSRSVLDGVYTEEQAKRGEAAYGTTCSSCHGATLLGIEMAPALTGEAFTSKWTDATVRDLFQKIRESMPADDPGTLSNRRTADIVAYVLSVGKFPPGKTELGSETEALKQIRIEAPKP